MRRVLAIFGLSTVLLAGNSAVEQARKLYNRTEFEQSLKILRSLAEKDAEVYELIGRNLYMQGDFKKASEAFESAVAAAPESSTVALWLGRSFGRRAETSSLFTAPGYASKARQWFERAVQLDSRNLEALSDLFEYYTEAPGFLGGGMDKAQSLVPKMARVNEAEAQWAQARLAEKHKEYSTAEDHLRRAIDAAPQSVGRFIELAKFLSKQGRYQEADESLARAEKVAPNNPRILLARADVYIKSGKNLQVAKELLKRYLNSNLSPDDPPRGEALKLLKQVQGS